MNTAVDVRLGKVTDVNKEKRLVRCKFEDTGITSGWLPVMQHYKAIGHVKVGDGIDVTEDGVISSNAKVSQEQIATTGDTSEMLDDIFKS